MPAFAEVPMSQRNSKAPLQAKGQLPSVKSPITDSHSFSNRPNTKKTDIFTFHTIQGWILLWNQVNNQISLFNKLKHIPHGSLDERPSGKLGESNKKRGIFRLEENASISLQAVFFGPKYCWFWVIFSIRCYQGKCSGQKHLEPFGSY